VGVCVVCLGPTVADFALSMRFSFAVVANRDTHKRKNTQTHHISQTHVYTDREHIELPALLLDDFIRSNKSNINQRMDNMLASIVKCI